MKCRHCATSLVHTFLDLGFAPPSNAYLKHEDLCKPEKYYPLKVKVCTECWLVQTEDYAQVHELFSQDYAYFSSTSSTWLAHAASYAQTIIKRLKLDKASHVIEIASNDGYLLKNFVEVGIPCLGIEPTASTASVAEMIGVPVLREFFGDALGHQLASEGKQSDLIVANNVYAHVPDINDFTRGLKAALRPEGTISLEFPHLLRLIENNQFDTIYHEHFSYLSLHTVERIFKNAGLRVWDVEQLSTHGGSLRIYGCHEESAYNSTLALRELKAVEAQSGLQILDTYTSFQMRADMAKNNLLKFLIEKRQLGKKVAAYGAAAKGNTILNYAGIKSDLIPFVCDAALGKQGKFLPGSHLPILPPAELMKHELDYLIVFPWNILDEIKSQTSSLVPKGTQFVTAIPELRIS